MDWIMDWIMDWTINWIMDLILNLILNLILDSKQCSRVALNAGSPNEQKFGLTVKTDMCVAISKTGQLVQTISLFLQPPNPAGLQEVAIL